MGLRARSLTVVFVAAAVAGGAIASCSADDATPAVDAGTPPESGSPTEAGTGDASGGDSAPDGADAAVPLVDTCKTAGVPFADTWLADPKLCLTVFASELSTARQMAFAPNGDLFVQARGQVVALFDTNGNGVIEEGESEAFATSVDGYPEINHGLAFDTAGAYVYASNAATIFRWPYKKGDHKTTGAPEVVVTGIPSDGGHISRTLIFDAQGRLYVNVGSYTDVEDDPALLATRSMVRRFTIPAALPAGGMPYASGEVYASGLRNEVGLTFDSKGRMWGVENGSDGVYLPQFGNLTDHNPGEEINRIDVGARFFGYPYCWSEAKIDGGMGPKAQWAYWGTPLQQTDAWCRNPANVNPPAAVMPAHWAPLGIAEYTGGSLPWKGDLFVAAHGSSFLDPPVGRVVARAHVVGDAIVSVTPVVGRLAGNALQEGTWDARPVDVRTGPEGALYVSDDRGGRVFRLGYRP